MTPRLILGSASPRRLELLEQLGIRPDEVSPPEINEDPLPKELPRPYCKRIASEKAAAVTCGSDDIVLCADTTVAVGRRILGKPQNIDEADSFLKMLSGRRHRVITVVCIKRGQALRMRDVVSLVRFNPLTRADRESYLASGEWEGKAGGYAIQGRAGAFIPWISGSFTGIVGLPLAETATLLRRSGYPLP